MSRNIYTPNENKSVRGFGFSPNNIHTLPPFLHLLRKTKTTGTGVAYVHQHRKGFFCHLGRSFNTQRKRKKKGKQKYDKSRTSKKTI